MEFYISPRELKAMIKSAHIRQDDMGKYLGLSQGQVSRLVRGQFKKPGEAYFEICKYVKNHVKALENNNDLSEEIKDAVKCVWDGSQEHAEMIARVIRSLGPFRKKSLKC